jgi:hypothetical protein
MAGEGWHVDLITAHPASLHDASAYDLVVLGAPTYNFKPAQPLLDYLGRLTAISGKPVVLILTGGGMTDEAMFVLFLVFILVDLAARKALIEDVERCCARTGAIAPAGMALMAHGVPFLVPHVSPLLETPRQVSCDQGKDRSFPRSSYQPQRHPGASNCRHRKLMQDSGHGLSCRRW